MPPFIIALIQLGLMITIYVNDLKFNIQTWEIHMQYAYMLQTVSTRLLYDQNRVLFI